MANIPFVTPAIYTITRDVSVLKEDVEKMVNGNCCPSA
jgi:hypothetical protein